MVGMAQREILDALIRLYDKKKDSVKGEDISRILKRSSGTIRNQMQTLRALGYVEGVPGPKGGYTPSIKAYEALGITPVENPHEVPIYREDKKIDGISAHKIMLIRVTHPSECGVIVKVIGDTRLIDDGDIIRIGPTPVNHIIVKGKVTGRDDTKRELLIDTHSITSIPKGAVGDFATRKLITIPPSADIKECCRILLDNRINAAPIIEDNKLVGIITVGEIMKAVADEKTDVKVEDILIHDIFTIDKEAKLLSCIKKMEELSVGRLIIVDEGRPVGIITRTDILQRMIE